MIIDSYPDVSGEDLVKIVLDEPEAFESLLAKYHKLIQMLSTDSISGMEQDDLYQLIAIKFYYSLAKYDRNIAKLSTYLYSIARTEVHRVARKANSKKRKTIQVSLDTDISVDSAVADIITRVDLASHKLTEQQRVCLTMKLKGYKNINIAEMLEVSNSRVSDIFKSLRVEFQSTRAV